MKHIQRTLDVNVSYEHYQYVNSRLIANVVGKIDMISRECFVYILQSSASSHLLSGQVITDQFRGSR